MATRRMREEAKKKQEEEEERIREQKRAENVISRASSLIEHLLIVLHSKHESWKQLVSPMSAGSKPNWKLNRQRK